jgi:excisionase family DNA binding protein
VKKTTVEKFSRREPYTVPEAAAYLKHSTKTIRRWIKRGLLRTSSVSRKILIVADDVERLVPQTCTTNAAELVEASAA